MLHHIALPVRSLAAAEDFYCGVLGFEVAVRHSDEGGNPRSLWLTCGEAIVMLERTSTAGATSEHLAAFRIPSDGREGWKAELRAAGVSIVRESQYSLYFFDPDGNRLALSHYPDERRNP